MPLLDDMLLGKMLDEYRVERALGTGGMARVYLALDTHLQRHIALKVIAPDLRTDEEYTLRFKREAQSIARLEHPNIVHIYRSGEVDGLYYIAMQYIAGVDVERIVEDYRHDGEAMALTDTARIVQEIGAALDYAHSRNVIHRDIKPGNIMLDKTGRAVLTDFGLALLSDVGTRGEIFGSPLYIAPEQAISSRNVVPQSDLYALGVVLFYMLTGDVPFGGDDPMEIALRHVSDVPPPPSTLNPALSAEVDAVVLHCLKKEPRDRYQTGAELSAALNAAVSAYTDTGFRAPAVGALRHSQLRVSEKVHDAGPELPPLPEQETIPPPTPHHQRATQVAAPAQATRARVADQPPPQNTANTTLDAILGNALRRRPSGPWVRIAFALGAILIIGICGLVMLSLLNQIAGVPTASAALATTAPAPTHTPSSAPTETLVPTPTIVIAPTPTPLVLIRTPLPQAASPTTPPTPALPADRGVVPPGSRRIGAFAVEWYCNERGLGVTIINNGVDWACMNRNNSINFILQPADFDQICQSWYKNPGAFAIRDQGNPTQAYNWSCYQYFATPTPVTPIATPAINSLQLRYTDTWVAVTNISAVPLSLDYFVMEREGRTLNAAAWGRSVLNPGECLVIYKGSTLPNNLPSTCAAPISLPADANEREYWLKGEVVVRVNPSVQYHYHLD